MKTMTTDQLYMEECTYSESKIQHTCVKWFRDTHPEIAQLMFAVSNGGARTLKAGAICKYEGQLKGVADILLLKDNKHYICLAIEMKTPKQKGKSAGAQKPEQKVWQNCIQANGSKYVVCHGLVEFITEVAGFLGEDIIPSITNALERYDEYLAPFPVSSEPSYKKAISKKADKANDEHNRRVFDQIVGIK